MKTSVFTLLLLGCGLTLAAERHIYTPLDPADELKESAWRGQWIGIDRLLPGETMEYKTRVNARYLRAEMPLQPKQIKEARVYIAAQGYYELYVNGERIGSQVLAPQQTDFRKSIIYNVHDVTAAMSKPSAPHSCIGVVLGNGRTVPMRYNKHQKTPFFGFPKCRVEVFVTYADGKRDRFSSSDKWKATADGPIRSNNEYDGEVYDARREIAGWAEPGYDDSSWQQAERAEIPTGALYPQTAPNQVALPLGNAKCRRFSSTKSMQNAELVNAPANSAFCIRNSALKNGISRVKGNVFDVQQNIAGYILLRIRGAERGDTIRIRYAERLNPDSTLYTANLRNAESEDIYVSSGKEAWWQPTFVYHGFRYVSIDGLKDVTENDMEAFLVSDPVETIGSFVSSNPTLNRIVQNAWWGIIDNYKGFPVDCPQRNERQPWLGDRTAGSLGESFLFDNRRLYTRWMRDICDAQRYDGCIPDVAPAFWNYYTDNVTWPAALPFTCEMLYSQFGCDEAIRNSYPYVKRWVEHIIADYTRDGIITKDKYGDWCMPPEKPELIHSEDPARKTDGALVSTAYMIHVLRQMANFATMQGFTADASSFKGKADSMTEAFNRKFLTLKRGTSPVPGHPLYPDSIYYGNNTATANLLPLAFGIVPDDCRKAVIDNVVENIIVKNNGHVPCGVIGISHLLRTLTANGYGDVAYLVATNTTYPSWGYMAEHGATTIWELWNGDTANPAMNSGNHVMLLGDLLSWCFQDLAGISNAPGSVGYKRLLMRPDFSIQDLDSIACSYRTPQGLVVSRWKKDLEQLHWTVTLPEGVTAEAVLPDGTRRLLASGTTELTASLLPPAKPRSLAIAEDKFVYDHSDYPETHASSIAELFDGTLLATYFGGTKERNPDVCIYTHRMEGGRWQKAVFVADGIVEGTERTACWNPVLYEMPDGEVWLFFKIGANVKGWTGWVCKSRDGGRTWSQKERLPDGFLGPIKNKPELVDGKLICPSSTEDNGWRLHFEIYDLATKQWTKSTPQNSPDVLAIQPSILRHGAGVLQAVARTRPTKAQREGRDDTRGKVATCWSHDGGLTWGETSLIDVPNNQSGLDAVTLCKPVNIKASDGRLVKNVSHVMIYNDFGTLPGTNKGPRTPLSIAVSTDGVTWHHALTLEDSPISQYSYPSIIQGRDGSLHCIYTWRRQRIAYKRLVWK